MATDERKRQQQRAKRVAKRKAVLTTRKTTAPTPSLASQTRHIALAAQAPLHECLSPANLFDLGLGRVVISRKMGPAQFGVAMFLLDVFCLGVKNAFFTVMSPDEYAQQRRALLQEELQPGDPAYLRKLVEGAVAYAQDLGFAPHPDYALAQQIWGNVDASTCTTPLEFGREGKPLFVAGPHDTPGRCRSIINTLVQRCGVDGFHYLVPFPVRLEALQ